MDARVEDEPVTDLHPQVVRDKILGALFPGSYVSLTRDELVDKTGLDAGVVNRELIQLIQSRLVSWPGAGEPGTTMVEFLQVLVATAGIPFSITSEGRTHLERRIRETAKADSHSRALKRIGPQSKRALEQLGEAKTWLSRADDHRTRKDSSGAVANALKAIEFAAKSLLLMAGYEVPEEHAVGSFMNHVIDSLTGEEWGVKLTRAELAPLAWLDEISAPLQIVSEYGYLGVPANEAITTRDADAWVESAKEAIYAVDHLLGLLTRGQLLFK